MRGERREAGWGAWWRLALLAIAVVPAVIGARRLGAGVASGWVGYGVAFLLAFVGAWGRVPVRPFAYPPPDPRLSRARWSVLLAGGTSMAAFAAARVGASDRLTVALWLGSVGLLLVPFWWPLRRAVRAGSAGEPVGRGRSKAWWAEVVACAILLVVAVGFRLPYLERFPASVHNDEGNCGLVAQRVIERWDGEEPFLFQTAADFYDFPHVGFVPSAVFQVVFPPNLYGHRLANVVLALVALVCLYLVVRDLWGPVAGLLVLGLGGVGHFAVHWSRSGLHSGHAMCLAAIAPFLAWKAMRTGRASWFALLGCCLGACMVTYNAALLVPLWLGTVLGGVWLGCERFRRRYTTSLVVTGVGAVIFLAPLLAHYAQYPETFMVRRSSLVLSRMPNTVAHLTAGFGEHYLVPVLRNNLERAIGLLNSTGDSNLQYGWGRGGMVDTWTAAGVVVGLGVVAAGVRSVANWSLLLGLFLPWLVGAVLSTDAVQYSRIAGLGLLIMVPPAVWGSEAFRAGVAAAGAWGGAVVAAGLAACLALTGAENFRLYFLDHDRGLLQPQTDVTLAQIAREARDAGPENVTLVLSRGFPTDFRHRSFLFIAGNRRVMAFDDPAMVRLPAAGRATFLVPARREDVLVLLQQRFPGGQADRRNLPFGVPATEYLRYVVGEGRASGRAG